MDEFKKFFYLIIVLVIFLIGIVLRYKYNNVFFKSKHFPNDECSFIPYEDGKKICLGQDAGFKAGYYQASSYCSSLDMSLPTREQAWYIWLSSENCQRLFASNGLVAKNKKQFVDSCYKSPSCKVQSISVKNYCNPSSLIKFSHSLQYHNGYFWLKDSAVDGLHYGINYSEGTIDAFKDNFKSLGVRCVKIKEM